MVLAGLIHKLGYRGTTSTALTFGDNDDCHGYLVGEAHQGLRYMFQMMNEARVGVGFGAAVLGYRGYRYALDYARDRLQGRHPDDADFSKPQVPIIEHADVKRLLLTQKAYAEAAIAMSLYGYRLVDDIETGDEAAAKDAHLLLDLLACTEKLAFRIWCQSQRHGHSGVWWRRLHPRISGGTGMA